MSAQRAAGPHEPAPSAGSPSRPDPRSGRRRARFTLLPTLVLLLGALGLFCAEPAAADVLVSNMGQQGGSSRDFLGVSHAQRFTTGSHTAGYYLESIELRLSVTGSLDEAERKTIGAELWSAATGGLPDSRLAILTVPSSVGSGAVAFTAPANTVLAANTRYYLVVYTTHFSLSKLKVAMTGGNDEDSGAATGWSIANNGHYLRLQNPYHRQNSPNRPNWQFDAPKRQIRVNGSAVEPPKTLTLTTDAAGGTAAEDAGTVKVTATLDQPATAAVTVTLAAGAASTASATHDYALPPAFTIARGETAAAADVTIVDDEVDEGDETLVLTASVAGLATTPATLTIADDDDAGVTVSDAALSVAAGSTATYTVVLDTKPVADVTVTPASGTADNATVSSGVTFTPDAWDTAQRITVTGVKAGMSIVTHALTSSDARYSTLSVDSVTVTVTAVAPGAPTGLLISAGDARLDLSWTVPSFDGGSALTGYDVHYTSSSTVANDAAVGTNVATEWVAATRGTETDPPTASQAISSLTNDTAYRVRVRAKNAAGESDWVRGSGTPQQTDTTGPAAPAFNPADGTTVADAGTNITLTFVEAVKKDDRNADFTGHSDLSPILTLKAGGSTGADIGYAATVNGAGTVITIDPTNDLSEGVVYVAISAGYYDANGNQGTAASATFTVDTPSTDATLSGLAASSSTSAGGTYSVLGLTPSTFSASTTSYTATVPHATTHVKLTPTVNEENATVGVRKGSTGSFTSVTSGSASAAIALDVGANAITVRVTAEDSTTKDYTVTVTRQEVPVTVTLSVSQNPVLEGSTVQLTAKLSRALSSAVTIPLTVTRGSAESGDYTTGSSIIIPPNQLGASVALRANQDTDEDDETLTVALGTLPSPLTAGTPSSLEITITDDDRLALSVETSHPTPACGAMVTDLSVRPEMGLRLTPAPSEKIETQTRIIPSEAWRGAESRGFLSIETRGQQTYGHSGFIPYISFAELRKNFPGFRGFEYRLKDTPSVTAQCTWRFDVDDGGTPPPPTPRPPTTGDVSPDLVPSFGDAAVADQSYTAGTAIAALRLPQARGGDGALTYRLTPSPPSGLTLDLATRMLTGTPSRAQEPVQYTWRATDENGDTATLTFAIEVEDPRRAHVKEAVKRALAAVARRAMSGALDNIGARFGDIGASGVSLAGQAVPLDGSAAAAYALRDCAAERFARAGFGPAPDCVEGRALAAADLFGASAFSVRLASADGDAAGPAAPLWAVWGRGELGTFAGRGETGLSYDGKLRTGWLGMDARAGPWVAGLAVSHGRGEADYGFAEGALSGRGRLETTMTAVYPYGRWTLANGLELRGVAGLGTGEARHEPEEADAETGDLSMRMASVGVRRALGGLAGLALAVRADASVTRMKTDAGPDAVHNLSAESWRLRAGLEASRRFALGGARSLEPFLEAAVRQDGGDGLRGSGFELAGGVRYAAPGISVEARGRWLAAHSGEGAEERGVSLTVRAGPGANGRGLFFALAPRWGAQAGGAQALWAEEMPTPSGSANDGALDARVGYGFALPRARGVLTPFAEAGLAGGQGRRLRLGARFEASGADLRVELAGERRESAAAEPEHELGLDLSLRF